MKISSLLHGIHHNHYYEPEVKYDGCLVLFICFVVFCCGKDILRVEFLSVSTVSNYNFDKSRQCIGAMTIEIDFLQKKSTDSSPYDSDKMAAEFIQQFNNQAFSVTQQVYIHLSHIADI